MFFVFSLIACSGTEPSSAPSEKPVKQERRSAPSPDVLKEIHEKLNPKKKASSKEKSKLKNSDKKASSRVDLNPKLDGKFVFSHPDGWCFVRGQDDKDEIPAGLNQPAVKVECPPVMKEKPLSECPGGLVRKMLSDTTTCTCVTSFLEPRPAKMVRPLACE